MRASSLTLTSRLACLILFASAPTLAQFGPVQAEARLVPTADQGVLSLEVTLEIAPGHHVYGAGETLGIPTQLEFLEVEGVELQGGVEVPPGTLHRTGEVEQEWLEGTVLLRQQLRVVGTTQRLRGTLTFMACTLDGCLPPDSIDFDVHSEAPLAPVQPAPEDPAAVADPPARRAEPPASPAAPPASLADLAPEAEFSLLTLFLGAVGAGLFALLMPCTYPMIPITVSIFAKQAEREGRKTLSLSLIYGAGIVGAFVGVGLVIGPAVVTFATHWLSNLVFGAALILFGLALLGAIDFRPPAFLQDFASKAPQRGDRVGVLLMGATLAITSFTCTAPFVGSLLALAADASAGGLLARYGQVALGMAVFGLTVATPFVVLSLMPGRLKALPRSGEWMNTLKAFLGFVEIGAALKFLSNVDMVWQAGWLPRELFLLLWCTIAVVAGAFLLGVIPLKAHGPPSIGAGRLAGGLATLSFAALCAFGALGNQLPSLMTALAPDYSAPLVGGAHRGAATATRALFKDDYEGALAAAKQAGKPLLVTFTGFTCVNCRVMEQDVFTRPEVARTLEGVVEVRLHVDHADADVQARNKALQQELAGSVALPTYVVVDRSGAPRSVHRLQGVAQGWDAIAQAFDAWLAEGMRSEHGKP